MLDGPYAGLAQSLRRMPEDAGAKPKAILMVSAHWEAPAFTVQAHPRPPMIYDYYGFPEHTYHVTYPAPGDPMLAAQVETMIRAAGLPVASDGLRGYDHGVYSPMVVAYPEADMPIVQLSLMAGLEPRIHVELGRVLAPLRREGVLIIGSGLSYHNLRAFGPAAQESSTAFDAWLCASMALPAAERTQALLDWEAAPYARQVHPREEHLLPLMVAVGAAEQDQAALTYHETGFRGGVTVSSFRVGAPGR